MAKAKPGKKNLLNFFILFFLILLNLYLLRQLVKPAVQNDPAFKTISQTEEIVRIKQTKNIDEQIKFYKKLIERVGPEQAQEELFHSGLPFDGQTHLLNHTVGDYLYEKYGNEGLTHCKDYFLSSCYHGFVLRAIGALGIDGLDPVIETCSKKRSLLTQCSHAIGHGLLVWFDYPNLIEALHACDEIGSKRNDFPLFNCYDGIFMENIWGVHHGKPSPDRWVKENDKLYPCSDPRIDEKYMNACWAEQPTIIFQQSSGNITAVSSQCLKLTNPLYQTTCFDSLARQINPMTNGNINQVFQLCSLVAKDWRDKCIFSNVMAFFSVGDRKLPFEICERMIGNSKKSCNEVLSSVISANISSPNEKENLCNKISDLDIRQKCI